MIVVDASVALTWALPAEDEHALYGARVVEAGSYDEYRLIAPTSFVAECSYAVLKRCRAARWPRERIQRAAEVIELHGVTLHHPSESLSEQVEHALKHHVQGYDSLYLALAIETGAALATFDRGLRAAANRVGVELFN